MEDAGPAPGLSAWPSARSCDSDCAMAARIRLVLLAAIGVLYVLSVPWYRESGAAPEIWLGLPDWVMVAIACYAAAAVLNAVAWRLTAIHDEEEAPTSGSASGPGGDAPGGTARP